LGGLAHSLIKEQCYKGEAQLKFGSFRLQWLWYYLRKGSQRNIAGDIQKGVCVAWYCYRPLTILQAQIQITSQRSSSPLPFQLFDLTISCQSQDFSACESTRPHDSLKKIKKKSKKKKKLNQIKKINHSSLGPIRTRQSVQKSLLFYSSTSYKSIRLLLLKVLTDSVKRVLELLTAIRMFSIGK